MSGPDLISRRTALRTLGAGLTGILNRPAWARLAEKKLPDFNFTVVSDTHIGQKDSDSAAKRWAKTAAEIDAAPGEFVLHLGDVVDGRRENQYPVYKEGRKAIRKPIHEIPGNHDPEEFFEKHIRTPIELAFDHQGIRFLLFNNSHTDSHFGFVTAKQLGWLGDQCAAAAKKDLFVIFCCHVPIHENKHPDRGWYVKPEDGQTGVYALARQHRDRVLAFFHGHFHNSIRGWDDHAPLQEVSFPSALYNQARALSKAPGYHVDEIRPGFVQVTIQKGQMKLHYQIVGTKDTHDKDCPLPQLQS